MDLRSNASILKPVRNRGDEEITEFTSTTTTTIKKRVSFSKRKCREFASDADQNTFWHASYEEDVSSDQKSDDSGPVKNQAALNVSSKNWQFDGIKEDDTLTGDTNNAFHTTVTDDSLFSEQLNRSQNMGLDGPNAAFDGQFFPFTENNLNISDTFVNAENFFAPTKSTRPIAPDKENVMIYQDVETTKFSQSSMDITLAKPYEPNQSDAMELTMAAMASKGRNETSVSNMLNMGDNDTLEVSNVPCSVLSRAKSNVNKANHTFGSLVDMELTCFDQNDGDDEMELTDLLPVLAKTDEGVRESDVITYVSMLKKPSMLQNAPIASVLTNDDDAMDLTDLLSKMDDCVASKGGVLEYASLLKKPSILKDASIASCQTIKDDTMELTDLLPKKTSAELMPPPTPKYAANVSTFPSYSRTISMSLLSQNSLTMPHLSSANATRTNMSLHPIEPIQPRAPLVCDSDVSMELTAQSRNVSSLRYIGNNANNVAFSETFNDESRIDSRMNSTLEPMDMNKSRMHANGVLDSEDDSCAAAEGRQTADSIRFIDSDAVTEMPTTCDVDDNEEGNDDSESGGEDDFYESYSYRCPKLSTIAETTEHSKFVSKVDSSLENSSEADDCDSDANAGNSYDSEVIDIFDIKDSDIQFEEMESGDLGNFRVSKNIETKSTPCQSSRVQINSLTPAEPQCHAPAPLKELTIREETHVKVYKTGADIENTKETVVVENIQDGVTIRDTKRDVTRMSVVSSANSQKSTTKSAEKLPSSMEVEENSTIISKTIEKSLQPSKIAEKLPKELEIITNSSMPLIIKSPEASKMVVKSVESGKTVQELHKPLTSAPEPLKMAVKSAESSKTVQESNKPSKTVQQLPKPSTSKESTSGPSLEIRKKTKTSRKTPTNKWDLWLGELLGEVEPVDPHIVQLYLKTRDESILVANNLKIVQGVAKKFIVIDDYQRVVDEKYAHLKCTVLSIQAMIVERAKRDNRFNPMNLRSNHWKLWFFDLTLCVHVYINESNGSIENIRVKSWRSDVTQYDLFALHVAERALIKADLNARFTHQNDGLDILDFAMEATENAKKLAEKLREYAIRHVILFPRDDLKFMFLMDNEVMVRVFIDLADWGAFTKESIVMQVVVTPHRDVSALNYLAEVTESMCNNQEKHGDNFFFVYVNTIVACFKDIKWN